MMQSANDTLLDRIARLERRCRRSNAALASLGLCAVTALVVGLGPGEQPGDKPREIVVTRLTLVDDAGQKRLVIGQDPKDTNRISRAAGLTLYDKAGFERGGFSTMDDSSVVMAMDAPRGVGGPMVDRLGLKVHPNGTASIMLIGNDMHAPLTMTTDEKSNAVIMLQGKDTGVPVRLIVDDTGGGLELIGYDMPNKKALIKRLDYKGETKSESPLN
jgi:hypothetical protein